MLTELTEHSRMCNLSPMLQMIKLRLREKSCALGHMVEVRQSWQWARLMAGAPTCGSWVTASIAAHQVHQAQASSRLS